MPMTAKPKGLAKIWQGIVRSFKRGKIFRDTVRYDLNILSERIKVLEIANANTNFYSRLESQLNQNQGLDFTEQISSPLVAHIQYLQHNLSCLFPNIVFRQFSLKEDADMYFLWGLADSCEAWRVLMTAQENHKPLFLAEDGFLRSADTWVSQGIARKYVEGVSFVLDDKALPIDATRASRLENMLNDKTLMVNEEQKQRAKRCIDGVIATCLTKYNHQPIFVPQIGRENVPKVLVIDQSYGDMSITKGWADDSTFQDMLDAAVAENPDADIIIKTHPDTIANQRSRSGYYVDIEPEQNLYKLTVPINPIALLKYVDRVYVCTSQLGFEALMCGKEVHVFGMPFYASWGLTKDRQTCSRRTHTRTLEEMFYIAYIMYSFYVNPKTKSRCEIEEAMDYLLALRAEYFEKSGVSCDCTVAATNYCFTPKDYSLHSGERQVAQELNKVRADHLRRYEMVAAMVKNEFGSSSTRGLDVFCGTGYGSYLIASVVPSTTVTGIDGSSDAIEFAKIHFNIERITYDCKCFPFNFDSETIDYVVSFESIEHVEDDRGFFNGVLLDSLKHGGLLFLSVPNAEKLDAKNNPFHFRHYRHEEVLSLAKGYGLELISIFGQDTYVMKGYKTIGILADEKMGLVKDYHGGQFLIYVFRKGSSDTEDMG